ncbi:MAG: hypothetical protein M1826_001371 [Phylliscum demangeonii]|nr:MAG: hypothetical protein M1826_001371 [Phylliscum demangeonii]
MVETKTRPGAKRAGDTADSEETSQGKRSEVESGSEDEVEVAAARRLHSLLMGDGDDVDDDSPEQAAQVEHAMEILLDGAWTADALALPAGAIHRMLYLAAPAFIEWLACVNVLRKASVYRYRS